MRVIIGDKEITLIDQNVKIAKKLIRHLLDTSKAKAEAKGNYSFYYTMLVVMHVLSADYIKSLTPEVLALILNAAAKGETLKRKRENATQLSQNNASGQLSSHQ